MPSNIRMKYEDFAAVVSDQVVKLRKILDGKFADKDLKEAEKTAARILDLESDERGRS